MYKTNRFNVAVCLLNNRSHKMPKCGDHENAQIFKFCSYRIFDLFCDLLLKRCTATWNLFVKYTCSICKCVCLQSCMIFVFVKEYKITNICLSYQSCKLIHLPESQVIPEVRSLQLQYSLVVPP